MYEDFFAERLSQLRQQKNVSAREMSLSLGQNGSYINRIENKHTFPSMQTFFYICEYLQITPQEFFDDTTKNPTDLNQLIDISKELDSEQMESLLSVANVLKKNRNPS
ncbi:MAG: helix-turn-helix domain-containing protein [Lachnospiraceae bacterium]